MLNAYIIPLAIVLAAGGLIWWNVESWRRDRQSGDAAEVSFARRQFRRRVQASGLLGLVGAALCVGQLIPAAEYPMLMACFWLGVVLLVFWAVLLALGDMAVNRQRLKSFQHHRRIEEAKLNAELQRLRNRPAAERNGAGGDKA